MNFVYCKTKKDATNYDIFLHIMYDFAERTWLEHTTTSELNLWDNQLLHLDVILRNVRDSHTWPPAWQAGILTKLN